MSTESDSSTQESVNSIQNNNSTVTKLILKPSNFKMTTNINEIISLIDCIPEYDGNPKKLKNFIHTTDEMLTIINTVPLSNIQKILIFQKIKNKLTDKGSYILSENSFKNWEELKEYLLSNFEDKLDPQTLLIEMLKLTAKKTTFETLELMQNKWSSYKNKINLSNYDNIQKLAILRENQKTIVRYFISLLPITIRGAITVKNPDTLDQCQQLLQNEFNFHITNTPTTSNSPMKPFLTKFNPPPMKFPADNFPRQPIHLQKSNKNSTPQNFIQKQNFPRYNPTPMSTQSRQTFRKHDPMSTQTRIHSIDTENTEYTENIDNSEQYDEIELETDKEDENFPKTEEEPQEI